MSDKEHWAIVTGVDRKLNQVYYQSDNGMETWRLAKNLWLLEWQSEIMATNDEDAAGVPATGTEMMPGATGQSQPTARNPQGLGRGSQGCGGRNTSG